MTTSLGEFEQVLLFALLRAGDGASSLDLRHAIEDRVGRLVSAGAVYTAMDRMEGRGLVASWLDDPGVGGGGRRGRRVKRYRLEPEGAQALQRSYRLMREMAAGLEPKLAKATASRSGGGAS